MNNFTQTPNALYQYIFNNLNKLTKRELAILLYITRKTYGYHRIKVKFTHYDVASEIQMARQNITTTLHSLIKKDIIIFSDGFYYINQNLLIDNNSLENEEIRDEFIDENTYQNDAKKASKRCQKSIKTMPPHIIYINKNINKERKKENLFKKESQFIQNKNKLGFIVNNNEDLFVDAFEIFYNAGLIQKDKVECFELFKLKFQEWSVKYSLPSLDKKGNIFRYAYFLKDDINDRLENDSNLYFKKLYPVNYLKNNRWDDDGANVREAELANIQRELCSFENYQIYKYKKDNNLEICSLHKDEKLSQLTKEAFEYKYQKEKTQKEIIER